MYAIELLIIKVLKRLKILACFNFVAAIVYNKAAIKVPFIKGIGLENFLLKKDWLDKLNEIYIDQDKGAFVDVGVNIGQTLIKVKTRYPEIEYVGFEPNAACVFYVNTLVEHNHFINCFIHNYALHSEIENLNFELTSATDSRASVVTSLRPGMFSKKQVVLGMPYDQLFIDKPVSFIKIDVEGAELDVLMGMRQTIEKYKPVITCEVLDSHSSEVFEFTQRRASLLSEFLNELNYTIIGLVTQEDKIVSGKIIDNIILNQWTKESANCNDYVFIPKRDEKHLIDSLFSVIQ